jgi:hypothetical protein
MNPLVVMGVRIRGGGTAIIAVFTGTMAGRSLTVNKVKNTGSKAPLVEDTRKAEPTACSKAWRSKAAVWPTTWPAGFKLVEGSCTPLQAAGKGAATNAAAATALFFKNFRLETGIAIPRLIQRNVEPSA